MLVSLTRYVATEFGKQGVPVQRDIACFIVIGEKPGWDVVMATMLRHHLTPASAARRTSRRW